MHRTIASAFAVALLVPALARAAAAPPDPAFLLGHESLAGADGASGFLVNPAAGGLRYPSELLFSFADLEPGRNLYTGIIAVPGFGLAATRLEDVEQRYVAGFGAGEDALRLGASATLRVSEIDGDRALDWKLGALSRPAPWLSLGATLDHAGQPRFAGARLRRDWGAGIGVRPLALVRPLAHTVGTRLTLTADVIVREGDGWARADLGFGAEIEPVPGIRLTGWIEEHRAYRVGIALLGPRSASHVHATVSRDGDRVATTYTSSVHRGEDRTALAGRAERRIAAVRIGGPLVDDALTGVSLFGGTGGTVVGPIHRRLERALEDPLTRAVLLDLRSPAGMGQLEELHARILALRAAGKPVVALLEYGANRGALFLASACDRVVTTEEAFFTGLGLRAERRYYRGLLERWGVRFDRASIGPYKSAYRHLAADSLPAADREVIEHNLDVAHEFLVTALAAGRRVPRERFLHVLDGRAWEAADLVRAGLVDTVASREDARAIAARLAGLGSKARLARRGELEPARVEWTVPRRIAVVYASGGIEAGESGSSPLDGPYMGSETVIRQLERAFRHRAVHAVVLRVDSPGGSAVASNLIHAAASRLRRETRKPLVVSMGNVAASGGYYIAAGADRIFANHLTATGSIGVVYVKPSLETWYAQRNVPQYVFERGEFMSGTSLHHDWTAAEQASADSAVARTYETFLAKVAAGRGRPVEEIRAAAGGRVWFGADARERGLVDAIGGLDDAIAEARRRARVPAGERIRPLEVRRPQPRWLERALGSLVRAAWERNMAFPESGGVRFEADVPGED